MEKVIFLQALGLEKPWYVEEFKLDVEKERLDIYLNFEKGSKFENKDGELVSVEQTENKTWKHLFFWQYPTYLHCRVPKLKSKDSKVRMIKLPWTREGSGFTLLFESFALELMKHMPLSKLGEYLQETDERLMRIASYYVNKSKGKANYSEINSGGVDETSSKKGHNYITTFINFKTKKVSCIVEGKGKETIKAIVEDIEKHGGSREKIKTVSVDFSPSFTAGIIEYIPKASIIYDRFHFMQFISKALDEVRRQETISNKLLKGSRYLWLTNEDKLKEKDKIKLEELKQNNKILAEVYQMKENIKEFFEKDNKQEAIDFLNNWCEWVMNSKIVVMQKVVKTIKSHWFGIINYIDKKINNGIVEGINSVIQTIKRRARGYKNFDNFCTMIYLKIGDFPICQD